MKPASRYSTRIDQGLDRGAEGFEKLDAGIGFVAVEDVVDGHIEVRGARLGSDEELGIGRESLFILEAVFAGAHEHELLAHHVGAGEVDLALSFVRYGDAVHAHVELSVAHGLDRSQ